MMSQCVIKEASAQKVRLKLRSPWAGVIMLQETKEGFITVCSKHFDYMFVTEVDTYNCPS